MKELKSLQEFVKEAEAMSASYDDIVMLMEMADEEEDAEMIPVIRKDLEAFEKGFEAFRNKTNTFMIKATTALYEVPLYDLDMLLEEGKKFLE